MNKMTTIAALVFVTLLWSILWVHGTEDTMCGCREQLDKLCGEIDPAALWNDSLQACTVTRKVRGKTHE